MVRQRRARYTPEFRAEAVRIARASAEPLSRVARDLGVNAATLGGWLEAARPRSEVPLTDDERSELRRLRKENRELRMERDILKSDGLLRQAERLRFQFIAAEKARYPVRVLCRCLGVTRSGFYAWRHRPLSSRAQQDARLIVRVQLAHAESRRTYGRPRLVRALRADGIRISGKRVRRLMRRAGIVARGRRRSRSSTIVDATAAFAPNRLRRRFTSRRRRHPVWAADITACWTREGWCYLAVLLDLASRQVVGWAVRRDLTTDLPLCALQRALAQTDRWPRVHHSDRGTQYTSTVYAARLAQHGIAISMSRRGNCWDNAPVESFFSTLKAEAWPDQPWRDSADATAAIADYIRFYNTRRLHSALGYQPPAVFAAAQGRRV